MRARSYVTLVAAGLLVVAACGGHDGSSSSSDTTEVTDSSTPTDDTTDSSATTGTTDTAADTDEPTSATLPPPAAVLEPTFDPTLVIGDDVAESLAALQFPRQWVLPDGGRADVVGATVQYSRGESNTSTTYRTGYTVPAGDFEVVAQTWAERFADALGIRGIERLGQITGDTTEAISWTTLGDAEPGKPDLDVTVSRTLGDTTGTMVVSAELQSVDVAFPDLVMPLDFDPTLPRLAACTVNRFDVQYDGFDLPNEFPEEPNYTLWWEGECAGLEAFDAAVAWGNANGMQLGEGTKSFSTEATSEDDITVKLSASRTDDGNSSITLIVVQPFGGEQ